MKPFQKYPFFIKLFNQEYWPSWIMHFPVFFYWPLLSIRPKTLFWFSAANPGIENGGMTGESKINILDRIPAAYKPKSIFIKQGTSLNDILEILKKEGVDFPIIAKPDVGERGMLVEKLINIKALAAHLQKNDIDSIIQPFVTYKEEFALYYYYYAGEEKATVFSLTGKEFLTFEGDGRSTLKELIMQRSRAILQLESLQKKHGERMNEVLSKDQKIVEVIGNHSKGTKFINLNHEIDNTLEESIYRIAKQINGVYFGRLDLKCTSLEDLKQGKNIQIVELNGVGADPAHIYDSNHSIWQTWKACIQQWRLMYKVSVYNHKKLGVAYMTFAEAQTHLSSLNKYKKELNI